MRPGLLGPPFGYEAVAAGASDPPLLRRAANRGGDETGIDVEGSVDDGEAASRRADFGEVAPFGGRVGEEKGAAGVELGAETQDCELRQEPLGPIDRGVGFLADLELRGQRPRG
jgi:hypothetical protein